MHMITENTQISTTRTNQWNLKKNHVTHKLGCIFNLLENSVASNHTLVPFCAFLLT